MSSHGLEKLLKGTKVMFTGLGSERKELMERVTKMGGTVQTQVNFVDQPHVLVARDVLSEKYRILITCGNVKITVVSPEWILACWDAQKFVSYDKFRLGPFVGLVICVSSLTPQERQDVQRETEKGGGIYSGDLSKKCTHLLTTDRTSKKYQFAVQWGNIHVVEPAWFYESAKKNQREDEKMYSTCKENGVSSKSTKVDQPGTHDPSTTAGDVNAQIPTAFGVPIHSQAAQRKVTGECVDLFLDCCRICFIGFEQEDLMDALKISRRCGATRYSRLHENLTHIILGRKPSVADLSSTIKLSEKHGVKVVYLSWLESSALQHRPACEKEHVVDNNVLKQGLQDPTLPYIVEADMRVQDTLECHQKSLGSLSNKNLFSGLKFCIAECGFTAAEQKSIVLMVCRSGGLVVDVKDAFDYAVFPMSAQSWKRGDQMVPADKRVTFHWIQSCSTHQTICPFNRLMFRPSPHQLPIKRATHMVVCVSGYDGEDRYEIMQLLEAMGATVSEGMKRRNTHLVLPWAEGQKYNYCQRWEVFPVTASWLFESMIQGRMLPEGKFPPPPRGVENININSASMASLLGPTQFLSNSGSRKQDSAQQIFKPSRQPDDGVPCTKSHKTSALASKIDHVTTLLDKKGDTPSPTASKKQLENIASIGPIQTDFEKKQTSPEDKVMTRNVQDERAFLHNNCEFVKNLTDNNTQNKDAVRRKSKRLAKAPLEEFGSTQMDYSQKVMYSDTLPGGLLRNKRKANAMVAAEDAKKLLRSVARPIDSSKKRDELKELGLL